MTRKKQDKNTEPIVLVPFDVEQFLSNAITTSMIQPEEDEKRDPQD